MIKSNTFGPYLKSLRESNKLTIAKLADLTGISTSYISRIEKGERSPTAGKLKQMAPHLQTSWTHLLIKAGYTVDEDTFIIDDEETRSIFLNLTPQKKRLFSLLDGLDDATVQSLTRTLELLMRNKGWEPEWPEFDEAPLTATPNCDCDSLPSDGSE